VKKVYFKIRNDGAGVLKIKDMTADCGCLQPTIDRRQIEKGQDATIEVVVTTSIIEGEAENKHIVVFSNDPRYPNGLQFHVVGTVVSTIGLRPERVVFDKTPFGESATRVIEMYETRNVGLKIEEAKTTSPFITVTYKPATIKAKFKELDKEAKKVNEVERECPGFRIELVLSDEAQVGRVDQLLLIKTNYKPRKDFPPIRIIGSVVGDFSYAPMNRLYIGGVRAGGRSTRRTLVVTSLVMLAANPRPRTLGTLRLARVPRTSLKSDTAFWKAGSLRALSPSCDHCTGCHVTTGGVSTPSCSLYAFTKSMQSSTLRFVPTAPIAVPMVAPVVHTEARNVASHVSGMRAPTASTDSAPWTSGRARMRSP